MRFVADAEVAQRMTAVAEMFGDPKQFRYAVRLLTEANGTSVRPSGSSTAPLSRKLNDVVGLIDARLLTEFDSPPADSAYLFEDALPETVPEEWLAELERSRANARSESFELPWNQDAAE